MSTWAKSTARATLLTASFVALGAGPALADVTDGTGSVLGGNQIKAPVSAPVDVSGNAVAVVGRSVAGSTGGASVRRGDPGGGQSTSGRHSVGGGNQVDAPVSAPVNVCGNAVAVFGRSAAGCEGGASVSGGHGGRTTGGHTTGKGSVLGGNQVNVPISAPVNLCGNSAAVLGAAVAGCKGGAAVRPGGHGTGAGGSTSGRHSVGGGNQVNVPIKAPVNVCGNAVGHAIAGCEGGAAVTGPGTTGGGRTSGRHSVLGGNQANIPVTAPINVCGNAAAILGDAVAGCGGVIPPVHGGSGTGGRTSGRHSVGGGNQATVPVTAPINVCGNTAAVIGRAVAGCAGDDHCVSAHHSHTMRAPLSELPQLPGTSSRTGAVAANPAAMPVFPRLQFQPIRHLSAPVAPGIPDTPRPPVAVPVPPTGRNTSVPSLQATGNTPVPSLPVRGNAPVPSLPVGGNTSVPSLPARANTPVPSLPAPGNVPVPSLPATGNTSVPASQTRETASVPMGPLDDLTGGMAGTLPDLPRPVRVGGPVGAEPTASGTARTGSPITGSGVADAIPGARAIPGSGTIPGARALPDLPSVPVTRPVPQAGAALPIPGRFGLRPVGAQPERILPMRTVAAQEPAQAERGALAALALAGLLAASSGAISMVRRFRGR
ncbi:hypothetical protein GCM10023196_004220 [Actinoallomurus vinaceus]|uniref:Chaplin domain-containing protein n=1 Tax=Actinoallomurus vinaceus TaxID=1080074 RepID=A0ABP8U3X4_9ACTN